ncbi:hypothetical protein [Salipiger mangrovisoli]|uniref:Uncharacterized protein n=1 Tax=Salipiger mangrovisoli TaxID=2865933 RepID=A0ABR9XBA5_9RHOB|nr:hypothetical protein [Salipiger mangrovisoli]MBE9640909.1 hypothetical protein [Salipiger mangrovisoli]
MRPFGRRKAQTQPKVPPTVQSLTTPAGLRGTVQNIVEPVALLDERAEGLHR